MIVRGPAGREEKRCQPGGECPDLYAALERQRELVAHSASPAHPHGAVGPRMYTERTQ